MLALLASVARDNRAQHLLHLLIAQVEGAAQLLHEVLIEALDLAVERAPRLLRHSLALESAVIGACSGRRSRHVGLHRLVGIDELELLAQLPHSRVAQVS